MKLVAALFFVLMCVADGQLAPNSFFVTGVATDSVGVGSYTYYPITGSTILGFDSSKRMYPVMPSIFATAAQGILAGTSVQPNNNVSLLTNDSGYLTITSASLVAAIATKFNTPTGTTSQILLGNGTLASLPAAQVQTDWNAVSGVAQILNKPTLGTAAAQNTSAFDASGAAATAQAFAIQRANHTGTQIASTITGLATVATSGSYADLSNRPTNVSTWTNDAGYLTTVPAWAFTNGAARTIQTVAAQANGWQLSSTRNATVSYSVSISTTTSIGGPAAGYVVLEVCSTNSSTAANWTEIARTSNSQTATLAVALQLVTVNGSTMTGIVPPGYYARLRSVVSSGTVAFAYLSGQEVLQ